jgi:hypothetical protein
MHKQNLAERRHNGQMQTKVGRQTNGVQSVDVILETVPADPG